MVAAAGISAAGSLLGGLFGSSGAQKAAKMQLKATREQIAATERNRDYQYGLNAPTIHTSDRAANLFAGFLGAGDPQGYTDWEAYVRGNPDAAANWAQVVGTKYDTFGGDIARFGQYHYQKDGSRRDLSGYTTGAGDGGSSDALDAFRNSSGYKDLVREGLSAVNANAYAKGMGRSGATYKALQDRGASLADRSAQGWLGNLGTLMNLGGQARGLVAGVGTNSVNATNAATQAGADAASNAALVSGQNWAQALQGIGAAAAQAYGSSYGGGNGGYAAPPTFGSGPNPGNPYVLSYGLNQGFA